jgi:drug/metabolite transporter (DMT)-like permease
VSLETVHQVKRFFKILGGLTLLFVGVVMLVTPGPGSPAIIGGLAMLAAEFVWARRLLNRLKSQGERLRQSLIPSWTSKA